MMFNLANERAVNVKKPNLGKVLVFCEGYTEYNYFDFFKKKVDKKKNKYNVFALEMVNAYGGGARGVLNTAINYLMDPKNNRFSDYEKILVFDLDHPKNKDEMLEVLFEIEKNDFNFVYYVSNRIFEIWLLMHCQQISDPLGKRKIYEKMREIYKCKNYGSKEKASPGLISRFLLDENDVLSAIKNAKELEERYKEENLFLKNSYKEMDPYSSVYLFMERILDI